MLAERHGQNNKRTRVGEILKLLVESGAIFCVIQSVYAASALIQAYVKTGVMLSGRDFYMFVQCRSHYALPTAQVVSFIQAWYPIVVIVLLTSKLQRNTLHQPEDA